MQYEIHGRDQSLGVYEGDTPEEAILACVRDAGYASVGAMEEALGEPCDLLAVPVSR